MRTSNAYLFRANDRAEAFLLRHSMPRTEDDLTGNLTVLTRRQAEATKPLTATVAERQEVLQ